MLVCCQAASGCCAGSGEGLGSACAGLEDCLCPPDRPSPIFVVFSVLMGGSGMVLAIWTMVTSTCPSNVDRWLRVFLVECFLNICFSFYLYKRITFKVKAGRSGLMSLILYDVGVYCYFFVTLFILVWNIYGFWVAAEGCGASVETCISLMFVYLFLGGCLTTCSIATQCWQRPKTDPTVVVPANPHGDYSKV
eukprot:NODE_4605_length_764_cov_26.987441_g4446_i0.p1 GENE.NODE_4605_length_764_cov_26.987441_g4446_i0~~NODE_4605_length_764_cov_26.987441_g4446_i0.p1  ORF type:complete len:193 (+),score=39.57 NODE_4605_length_764_cov_26.987441_g4446_i0:70-648(+)